MIVEFSVANYLSFRDKVTLSFVASPDRTHPENVIRGVDPGGLDLLRSVVVYGANASGKSNLVKAVSTMRHIVEHSIEGQTDERLPITAFRLDESTAREPSEFELVFVANGERYVYGFTADAERIHEEWLTASKRKPRVLFEREPDGNIHFGPSWRGERRALKRMTRPNALLLSVAAQFNTPLIKPAFDVFCGGIRTLAPAGYDFRESCDTARRLEDDPDFTEIAQRFLEVADLGIYGLSVERVPNEEQSKPATVPSAVLRRAFADATSDDAREALHARTAHKTASGNTVNFDLDSEESDGTQRLFALVGLWAHVIEHGCLLVIDEIGAHLHPLLTRFLVSCSHEPRSRAQFLFTTHDTSLLAADLFRRDQIWFTEKKPDGATDLYSLWDYKEVVARNIENYRKNYLQGRYGAIPFVGEFCFGEEEAERCPRE